MYRETTLNVRRPSEIVAGVMVGPMKVNEIDSADEAHRLR
jgi:hypothetical protein